MNNKPANKISIMLIDDNDTDNFINEKIIEFSGYSNKITTHNSAISALSYLNLHKGNILQLPDLIFLDLNMPIMDGFTFLLEFKNLSEVIKNKCKIIILSSSINKPDFEKVSGDSCVIDYISKPLSLETLGNINRKMRINDLIPD